MGSHISLSRYVVTCLSSSWEIDGYIGRTCVGMRFSGHRWSWVSEIVICIKHGCLCRLSVLLWRNISAWSFLAYPCASSYVTWRPQTYVFSSSCSTVLLLISSLIECVRAWLHQSWFQVSSVFLFSVFPALIYYVLVYAYYRQTINRNHSACLVNTYGDDRSNCRTAPLGRTETYSQVGHIHQRNNNTHSSSRNGMTSSRMEYAHNLLSPRRRTAQVPKSMRGVGASNHQSNKVGVPVNKKPPFVSKSLRRDHRPPPLIQSPSPIGLSPGPPSYGPLNVYAAFAAPVLSW